jgi:hypothetical protein
MDVAVQTLGHGPFLVIRGSEFSAYNNTGALGYLGDFARAPTTKAFPGSIEAGTALAILTWRRFLSANRSPLRQDMF